MRSLEEIIKLPILSRTGEYLGVIEDLVLNPKELIGVGFLVKGKNWYMGMKFVGREDIEVLGKNAVITKLESLRDVKEFDDVIKLLDGMLDWKKLSVYNTSGEMIGKVQELLINEETLAIDGIKLYERDEIIPRENIIALGSFAVLVESIVKREVKPSVQEEESPTQLQVEGQTFEAKQSAYLIGKKLIRDIIADDGTLIASKGEVVSWQLLRKMRSLNRFQELINSIEQ